MIFHLYTKNLQKKTFMRQFSSVVCGLSGPATKQTISLWIPFREDTHKKSFFLVVGPSKENIDEKYAPTTKV